MAFNFDTLTAASLAGYSTINALVNSINTTLDTSPRILSDAAVSGAANNFAIIWSSGSTISSLIDTDSLAPLAVTTAKIEDDAVTQAKIAPAAVGAVELASTLALTGKTISLNAATTSLSGSPGSTSPVSKAYVDSEISYVSSGGVTLAGDVGGPTNNNVIGTGVVTSDKIQNNTIVLNDLAIALQELLVPAGTVTSFAGTSAPSGWLLCHGQLLNATSSPEYAALWAVISTTYGGSGITAFNVPDLRGRTLIGVGTAASGATLTGVLAGVQGAATKSLVEAELPNHAHSMTHNHTTAPGSLTSGNGDHIHGVRYRNDMAATGSQSVLIPTNAALGAAVTTTQFAGSGNHQHYFDVPQFTGNTGGCVAPAGSGTAFALTQPSIGLNYIIKY